MKFPRFLLKLFTSTFVLSAFTFGGGYVIISYMKDRFAEKLKWASQQEITDMVAIAGAAPGVIAVNTSIMLGYYCGSIKLYSITGGKSKESPIKGVIAGLTSMVGAVLPPFIIMLAVAGIYSLLESNKYVRGAFWGMNAAICATVADVVINMSAEILADKESGRSVIISRVVPSLIAVLAFLAIGVFSVNIALVIAAAGVIGVGFWLWERRVAK